MRKALVLAIGFVGYFPAPRRRPRSTTSRCTATATTSAAVSSASTRPATGTSRSGRLDRLPDRQRQRRQPGRRGTASTSPLRPARRSMPASTTAHSARRSGRRDARGWTSTARAVAATRIDQGTWRSRTSRSAAPRSPRLWIVYEQHCEGGPAALFGEVRLGEPGMTVRWRQRRRSCAGVADLGGAGRRYRSRSAPGRPATPVGSVSLEGADAGEFAVRLDDYRTTHSRPARAAGCGCASCRPRRAPTRRRCASRRAGGRTTCRSRASPTAGARGCTWSRTPATTSARARPGTTRRAPARSRRAATGRRVLRRRRRQRRLVVRGLRPGPRRHPSAGRDLQRDALSVQRLRPGHEHRRRGTGWNAFGRGACQGHRSAPAGGRDVARGRIDFEQHCEGAGPALRGSWELRAGDSTPLPPWMVGGPSSVGPPGEHRREPERPGSGGRARPPRHAPARRGEAPCAGAAQLRLHCTVGAGRADPRAPAMPSASSPARAVTACGRARATTASTAGPATMSSPGRAGATSSSVERAPTSSSAAKAPMCSPAARAPTAWTARFRQRHAAWAAPAPTGSSGAAATTS